ncbi:MAG: GAF domain-containing protein [Desulfobacteraceae bacterium]|jgi:PAS domain S-box-containing protein
MEDEDKKKDKPIKVIEKLKKRIAESESSDAQRKLVQEELHNIEERFRLFADYTYDWETWRGSDGKYIYVSPSCERITGYQREEFISDPWLITKIVHPDDEEKISEHLREESVHKRVLHVDFRIISRTGEERWISHYCQAVYGKDGSWLGRRSSNRDITERKQVQTELQRVNRALKVLSGCNQAMMRSSEEVKFLQEVCQIIVEEGEYRLAWVGFAEQDKKKRVRPVAQAGFEEGYLETAKITWADTERGRGPTGTAIRTGKPSICQNMLTDPKYIPWRVEASKRGYTSSIALPLFTDDQIIGALNIYAVEPDAFDSEEVKLLLELGEDLAYGITTLRTRAERKQAEEALRQARDELYILSQELEQKVQERTAELEAKSKQLVEAERLATLGKIANRVAHELRNPLTVVGGFSRRMYERTPDDDPSKKYLKIIVEQVRALEDKISEIIKIQNER